jgi:hypothetical protein
VATRANNKSRTVLYRWDIWRADSNPTRGMDIFVSLRLYSLLLGLGRFIRFLILYTVGRTPWTGDQPIARSLPAHTTAQTQNKCTQTFMPWVGFEPTITVLERAKTVHAVDRAATVIGRMDMCRRVFCLYYREPIEFLGIGRSYNQGVPLTVCRIHNFIS